ncbi:MAG: class II aldolase/adducin family protein [Pseudomonadota bacterium]
MGNRQTYLINQIVEYAHRLDQKGFVANHDGNISARFDDILLATPTAASKITITPEMILTLDQTGKKLEGLGKPFSEIQLHLAAYQARDTVKAVVHAHPPFATAHGLVNLPLKPLLPEAIISIGAEIPVVPFTMPGENPALISTALSQADVFMLAGNGVLAVGENVEQAYLRLELLEHVAKIQFYAKQMGVPMELSEEEINTLLQKRASIGLGQAPQKSATRPVLLDDIKALIRAEIENSLDVET